MSQVLNAQSDSIVVVQAIHKVGQAQSVEDPKENERSRLEFQFCNSKSIELFGFDVRDANTGEAREERALDILKQPRFVNLDGGTPRGGGTSPSLGRLLSL